MKILNATISNLFSIKFVTLAFNDSGLILLNGLNHDDRDRSNGSGKTSMLLSLSYGIYGKFPKDVGVNEIIRMGEEKGSVDVTLQIGEDIWRVKRERPKKETYWLNGIVKTISQEEFERAIGLTYDHYLISLYFAQDNINRFLSLGDSDKKTFLLHLKNLDKFHLCKKECLKEINTNKDKKREVQLKVESVRGQIKVYTEQLLAANKDKIIQQMADASAIIGKNRLELFNIPSIAEPDFTDLDEKRTVLIREMGEIKGQLNSLRIQKQEYERKIGEMVPCPHCNKDIVIIGSTLNKPEDNVKDIVSSQIIGFNQRIEELETAMLEKSAINNKFLDLHNNRKKQKKEYDDAQFRTLNLNKAIDYNTNELVNLKEKLAKVGELRVKLETLVRKDLDILAEEMETIDSEILLLSTIEDMFSSTGIPSYVLDGIVDNLNTKINKYINLIWSNATYNLKTYKENNKGDISTKFSYLLTINGVERTIGSLSGGEARAFSLAIDFAVMDLLSSEYGAILSPIILDEPFNGLDSVGKQEVISVLKKIAVDRQIVVVDHTEEFKIFFDKIWTMEKKNDVSELTVSL